MRLARILPVLALVGCNTGNPPDILGLSDQTAVVGQELTVELNGVDPDGDRLTYKYEPETPLEGRATVTVTPDGKGVFRWTPIAADLGPHVVDFIVNDGSHNATVTITIDVRATAAGVPQFLQPLGTGRVVNLANDPCITVDIVVEDQDTAQVTITEEEPKIAGGMFNQLDGTTASWRWCPTQTQIDETDRYTLVLSADDADHPKTMKNYVLVLGATPPRIVINEMDYDNTGTDEFEYVEIYNPTDQTVSLAGIYLVFVNGSTNAEYDAVYLGDAFVIFANEYVMVAGAGVDVPASAYKLDPGWTTDAIQNGAPDGMAIIDDVTHTVLDAVSYEGAITAANIIGFSAPVSLVEGTATTVSDSDSSIVTMCRLPNGVDTNNAATDWQVCSRTKGAANAP